MSQELTGPHAPYMLIVYALAEKIKSGELKPGDRVFLMLNAANRDERVYADPDRLDLARDGVAHLTFGFGMHICLGFPLARLEGEISLPAVLRRFSRIELAGEPQWINSMVFRGMSAMPLRAS